MRNIFIVFIFFVSCKSEPEKHTLESDNRLKLAHANNSVWIQYDFLDNIEKQYGRAKDNHQAAYLFSNTGNYFSALEVYEKNQSTAYLQNVYFDSLNFIARPAIKFISEKANNYKIIIINEAHHISYHRFFTMKLLKELRAAGFNYFGAETLIMSDSSLAIRKYPNITSGYYSVEPQYGNMIRQAFNLGFNVFAYEPNQIINDSQREIDQARNIEKILKKDPNAKILIHCGYGHLLKEDKVEGGKAMAGRIKEYTGIDPLTIDQVELSEHYNRKFENPYFGKFNFQDFTVLQSKASAFPFSFRMDGLQCDIFVYHPRTHLKYNRPSWLFSFYTPRIINDEITIAFPVLVKAYFSNEDEKKAVPTDVIEIRDKKDLVALALTPKKKYKVVIINQSNQTQLMTLQTK